MMKRMISLTALAATLAAPAFADADADIKKGEKVFKKCKACHQVGEGAKNRTGPVLTGIVGKEAGAAEGFKYSKALSEKAAEGLIWDEAALTEFLKKPRSFVKGTKMSFAGLRKDADIENVIAYLKTFE